MSPDDLTVSGTTADDDRTLSMTVVGAVTTGRPPDSVVTVRIHNGGPTTARFRVFAVDDWSSNGPVPAEPSLVDLRPGRQRDVLVHTGRPWVRPFGRERSGAVTVYADLDGEIVVGTRYEVPAVLSQVVVGAAAVLLLAGLGVAIARPDTDGGRYPLAVPAVTAEPSFPPPPPVDPNALPADIVYDTAYDTAAATPVLVDRDRNVTTLPAGGRVTSAVKVPAGWVVARESGGVVHVRGSEVVDLAPGTSFWVDSTGSRVLIDNRPGTLTVVSLIDGSRMSVIDELPDYVRIVNWDTLTVLVNVNGRYDRWLPGFAYLETPSLFAGNYLGAANGEVIIYQRDGTLDCILRVPDLFRPIGPALRCGFGVSVDGEALRGRWSAVSPGGRYAAVPDVNGSAFMAPLPAMLRGRAGFEPITGLPGPITDLTWRDSVTAVVLVRGDDANVWTCSGAGEPCRPMPLKAPNGSKPALLAPRIPA